MAIFNDPCALSAQVAPKYLKYQPTKMLINKKVFFQKIRWKWINRATKIECFLWLNVIFTNNYCMFILHYTDLFWLNSWLNVFISQTTFFHFPPAVWSTMFTLFKYSWTSSTVFKVKYLVYLKYKLTLKSKLKFNNSEASTYLLTYSMEQSPSWEANWFCS